MLERWVVTVAVLTGASAIAAAEDPAALVTQGEALAKSGEFTRAIDAFKRAEAIQPSAAHECLIGLVYTRRELWSQAEIFLDRCKQHATATDPTPDWLPDAVTALAQKLADVDAAPIEIRVEPANASQRITVSSFAPDESFEPRTIHLAPGNYTITASPVGRLPVSATITVTSHTAQIITLVAPPPPPPPPPPPTRAEKISKLLFYGAGGAAVVGIGFHALSAYERSQLSDAQKSDNPVSWDQHAGTFTTERDLAIGFYGVAVVAAAVGIVLRVRDTEQPPSSGPSITGSVNGSGATVGLEWRH